MKQPILITSRGFPLTKAIENAIHDKANKLCTFFDRIISCRVIVFSPHKHHYKGNAYNVNIGIKVPGYDISVKREPHEDLYIAIREAFDAARRQLKVYARKRKQAERARNIQPRAKVTSLFLDHGYGFIATPEGREIYFHKNSVLNNRFKNLQVGTAVRFVEDVGNKGPQASTLTAL
jgi:ribosomal subunit interface protein